MTEMSEVFFDDSLPLLARTVRRVLSEDALREGIILRDAVGQLSFIVSTEAPSDQQRERIIKTLKDALGSYARPDRVLAYRNDPGANQLLHEQCYLPVQVDGTFCRLLDRRIVGAGWLEYPQAEACGPSRLVFASLKGGVGRSTALSVAAADLSRRNRNVLVVDLDLEAPGLGDFLLDETRMPRFGSLDFLVEDGIGGVSDARLDDFVGTSSLTTGGGGRVDVVPALGRQALLNPENVLPKLSRAVIEDLAEDGSSIPVVIQISAMIKRLIEREEYDVVLIDSRAGLSELAAPAILGLGATVLLFGTAQKQTIDGYRSLFAELRLLAQRDRAAGREADWRLLLKPVYAKASLDPGIAAKHRDDLYDLFAEYLYDAENEDASPEDAIAFDIDDPVAPHSPLLIPFSQSFLDFDSARNPNQLTQAFYEQTFRPFLSGIDAAITAPDPDRPVQP
jgi:hypothetical protein